MFQNRLLAGLSDATITHLSRLCKRTAFSRGQILQKEDAPAAETLFVEAGLVGLVLAAGPETKTGNLAIIGLEGHIGPVVGAPAAQALLRAVALTDGAAMTIDSEKLARLADQRDDLREALACYAQFRLEEALVGTACNARHGAAARLARWLLTIAERAGETQVPLRQHELAALLGVQRTTVTSAVNAFVRAGAAQSGRGRVKMVNPMALEIVACECRALIARRAAELGIGRVGFGDKAV